MFEVRATNGNTHLGGEDFDIVIMNYIWKISRQKRELIYPVIDLLYNVLEKLQKSKIELDHSDEIEINIPFVSQDKHIKQTLTSQEFTKMVMPIIEKTIDPVKRCVRDAELKFKDIDEVLLVGGMTRMPQIRKMVQDLFGKTEYCCEPRRSSCVRCSNSRCSIIRTS